ncbi:MAG: DUF1385 domain-containing protein [Ardenticatenaceae bacterium]|nr:DUF1385 domain-containing protein [Ardenticatenaceae bacterium]HBY99565.1 DUF1385 domain-containing protein [Chloroflexota bacterium]
MSTKQEFNYGGQAVIEGVMMRGAQQVAVAVRAPDGQIVVQQEPLTAAIYTSRVGKWPFVRGLALLWDALGLGMRALMWSADVAIRDEKDASGEQASFAGPVAWGTVAVSLAFGIGLFFILPLFISRLIESWIPSHLLANITEGVVRLAIFLGYLVAIRRMGEIQRVFSYHGAEHKTINAYEAGAELTPESVRRFSTLHPRCGTGFLLVVMVVSIFVFSLLGRPNFILMVASRILLIPVVAAISYEFIRWSARHYANPSVRALITPSLMLQKLTTNEPDLSMLEVAIVSLKHVLVAEGILAPEAAEVIECGTDAEAPALV